jgi:hypothetical protein
LIPSETLSSALTTYTHSNQYSPKFIPETIMSNQRYGSSYRSFVIVDIYDLSQKDAISVFNR